MKKNIFTLIFLILLLTACMPDKPGRPNILKDTAGLIGSFFALEWLTGINPAISFIAFIRIIIFIITFFILFEILDHEPLKNKISRRAALIIAISTSLMSTIFIPPTLLITIALMYTTLFATITAGIPTLIAIWLAFSFTPQTKFGYATRAAIILLAFILIGSITEFTENTLQQGNIRRMTQQLSLGTIPLPDTQLIRTIETLGYWTYYAQITLIIAFIINAIMAVFGKIPTYKPGIIEDIITGITGYTPQPPTTQYTRTGQEIPTREETQKAPPDPYVIDVVNKLLGFVKGEKYIIQETITTAQRIKSILESIVYLLQNNEPQTAKNYLDQYYNEMTNKTKRIQQWAKKYKTPYLTIIENSITTAQQRTHKPEQQTLFTHIKTQLQLTKDWLPKCIAICNHFNETFSHLRNKDLTWDIGHPDININYINHFIKNENELTQQLIQRQQQLTTLAETVDQLKKTLD